MEDRSSGANTHRQHQSHNDYNLGEPADHADPNGATCALVVECLADRDHHGNQHPDVHCKHDQAPEQWDQAQHSQQDPERPRSLWCARARGTSERVLGSGRSLVPIRYTRKAQMNQPTSALTVPASRPELLSLGVEKHQAAFSSGTWLTGTPLTYLAPW